MISAFIAVALNYEEIQLHPERVSNIKPFINKYNWKGINKASKIDDWKTKNNPPLAVNILCLKEKEIRPAYILKINSNCEKQIMIPNEEKEGEDYLALKNYLHYYME